MSVRRLLGLGQGWDGLGGGIDEWWREKKGRLWPLKTGHQYTRRASDVLLQWYHAPFSWTYAFYNQLLRN